MGEIQWGLLDPNSFQRGYQQTKAPLDDLVAQQKKNALDAALRQYVTHSADPNALNALAVADPATALPLVKDQHTLQKEKHDADAKVIAALARDAKDPASFDAAVDQVVSMGYPGAAQFKGKFNPGLRAALMAAGGLKDERETQDPGMIREFDLATQRGLVPQGTTFQQYVTMRNPGMSSPVTLPYGAQVEGGATAAVTATGPNGQKIQLNPQTGQWEPVGGAGGNVSGGFPPQ